MRFGRVVFVFSGIAWVSLAFGQVKYALLDLGTLGGTKSYTTRWNQVGQIAGYSYLTSGHVHGFLYSGGALSDLGTLGGVESTADCVNAIGQVVGQSTNASGNERAFVYSGGVMTDLGTLGGATAHAEGINDAGQIAGESDTATSGVYDAFLYSDGVMHDLGRLSWATWSDAGCINNSGQMAGFSGNTSYWHAVTFTSNSIADLGTLGGTKSTAYFIDDAGDVVGWSQTSTDSVGHPFLYSGGTMTDLAALPGGNDGYATGINASGQIVGAWINALDTDIDGFLVTGGTMYNLNSLLDSSGSGWTVRSGTAIDDAGRIAGVAYNTSTGATHAVLLTPDAGASGTVTLQGYSGDVTQVPVTLEVRKAGTTTVLQRTAVYLQSNGTFTLTSSLVGTYDVAAKSSHWLRKTLKSVAFSGSGYVSGLSLSLINGDVNGDNTINLADLVAMAAAWRTTPGSAKWNANADLNGDGTVNLSDWMIAAKNWRKSGDP